MPPTSSLSTPSFRQLPLSPALDGAGQLQLADLDGDGRTDAVAAFTPEQASESALRIVRGDGRGGFSIAQTITIPFAGVNCLAVGDLNGDGVVDIAAAAHDSYDAWLLFGSGHGGFSLAPQPLAMSAGGHPHTHSLVAADMNGDGLADLLSTCADDNAIAVQLQQPGGGFAPAPGSPFAAGEHPYEALTCADVNGDGKLDCVAPNLLGRAVSVLLGDGTGALRQASSSPLRAGYRPGFIAVGDLDGDSHLDIATSHDDVALVGIYYGDGKGGFAAAEGFPLDMPARCWSLAIADLDGDGRGELLGAELGGAIAVFPGERYAGALPAPQRIAITGGELEHLQVADFNADGKPDLLVDFSDTRDAVVLLQD